MSTTTQREDERSYSDIVDLAMANARDLGDQTAYRFLAPGDETSATETAVSYLDVHDRARSIAGFLQDRGSQDSTVLLLFTSGQHFIEAFFGCQYANTPPIPLAVPRTPAHIAAIGQIAKTCNTTTVLTNASLAKRLHQLGVLDGPFKHLEFVVVEDIDSDTSCWKPPVIDPSGTAFFQFTSGSTGSPKGVSVSHQNVMANQSMIEEGFAQAHDARVLGWLPLYHDMGLIGNVLNPFWMRRECILMQPEMFLRDPSSWLKAISYYKATTSGGPNFSYDLCVKKVAADPKTMDLRSWRIAFVGSDPIQFKTLESFARKFESCGFRATSFYPCYGLAEATLIVTGGKSSEPVTTSEEPQTKEHVIGCGSPLGDVDLRIVDPKTRIELAPSKVGEIWLRGPSVTAGYYGEPEKTKETYAGYLANNEGPFLRTGDLARIENGQLFIRGRLKNIIILNGVNIFAEDVQSAIDGCDTQLKPGLVSAFPIQFDGAEHLGVLVEARAKKLDSSLCSEIAKTVRRAVQSRLDLPTTLVAICANGAMPRTTSGKIQHYQCRSVAEGTQCDTLYRSEKIISVDVASRDAELPADMDSSDFSSKAIELWLCGEIARLINTNVEDVNGNDPFSNSGISSIDAIDITARMSKQLGVTFEETLFWEYPSPIEVAKHAESLLQDSAATT